MPCGERGSACGGFPSQLVGESPGRARCRGSRCTECGRGRITSRHFSAEQLSVFDIQLTSTISILQHAVPSSVYFYNIHCSARLSLSCPWHFVRAAEHPEEHPSEQRIQLSHGPDQGYFPSESPGWTGGWGLTEDRYPFIRISECISARVNQLGSNSRSDYWRDVPFYSGMIPLAIG